MQHAFTLSAPTVIGAKRVFKLGMESQADAQRWHRAILGALRALGPAELDPEPADPAELDSESSAASQSREDAEVMSEQPSTPQREPEGQPGPPLAEQVLAHHVYTGCRALPDPHVALMNFSCVYVHGTCKRGVLR